jgi:hypothetical protein
MSSRFNIGSKIYNATTGVESGDILHDGTYTATTTPASADTLLIKQSGVQKQITYANLTAGLGGGGGTLTANLLANRTASGPFSITVSNSFDSVMVFMFSATGTRTPSLVAKLNEVSTSSSGNKLYQGSSEVAAFQRSSDNQIIINTMGTGNFYVYELVVV